MDMDYSGNDPVDEKERNRSLGVVFRQRDDKHRKLSESRGVHLPNIAIAPPARVKTAHQGSSGSSDSASDGNATRTPTTAASPVGTIVRLQQHPLQISPDSRESVATTATRRTIARDSLDVRVFLPDNRALQFTIDGGRSITSVCLAHICEQHLNIPHEVGSEAFALWLVSPLLEVQLKPHHVPFQVRLVWPDLLLKYTTASEEDIQADEPLLMFRRNVLMSKRRQKELVHSGDRAMEVLYLDARESVLFGRQPIEMSLALDLAALDMAIHWGPYNANKHTLAHVKQYLPDFLPEHLVSTALGWTLFGLPSCGGVCHQLIERYREYSSLNPAQLQTRYVHECMRTPTYGCAFFTGQIERAPMSSGRWLRRSLSGAGSGDAQVLFAINRSQINIIDEKAHQLILSQPLLDCVWKTARSSNPTDPECLPSVFIHFPSDSEWENGDVPANQDTSRQDHSFLVQIFTRQAPMVEALLNSSFDMTYDELEEQGANGGSASEVPSARTSPDTTDAFLSADDNTVDEMRVCDKLLEKFCVATLDADGNCTHAIGSLRKVLDAANEAQPSAHGAAVTHDTSLESQ